MMLIKIRIFWNLSFHKKKLFCISFILCGLAKTAIHLLGYRRLAFYYGHAHRMRISSTVLTLKQQQQAQAIRRAIAWASAYTPWRSNCLTQAIVAKFWCQRYQLPYMLFIGLAKNSQQPLGKEAHAWLTAGPLAITGGHCLNTHHVVLSYSNLLLE